MVAGCLYYDPEEDMLLEFIRPCIAKHGMRYWEFTDGVNIWYTLTPKAKALVYIGEI